MQYFEETYEVLSDFCINRGYVNGGGEKFVPNIIDDHNVVVPDYFMMVASWRRHIIFLS